MPADTFSDLDALAANGDGSLWRRGPVWSYPNAPTNDPRTASLVLPIANVPDSRVQAALQAGAWVAAWIDDQNTPIAVLAVRKAPVSGVVRARTIAEFGTAA